MAKSRSRSQATRGAGERQVPFWIWLLVGIGLGLALAAVALYKDWVPALRSGVGPQPNPQAAAARGSDAGVAEPAKPAETKPKYDFYSVLPEMEVVIPESEITAEAAQPPPVPSTASTTPARLFLQAGSFRSQPDAEQMKAKLALLGQRAAVVSVTVNGATWHRVRVGPFGSARELDESRRALADSGVSAIALRETQ